MYDVSPWPLVPVLPSYYSYLHQMATIPVTCSYICNADLCSTSIITLPALQLLHLPLLLLYGIVFLIKILINVQTFNGFELHAAATDLINGVVSKCGCACGSKAWGRGYAKPHPSAQALARSGVASRSITHLTHTQLLCKHDQNVRSPTLRSARRGRSSLQSRTRRSISSVPSKY